MNNRPEIGARVFRPYGRKEYLDYGEVGTVTAHLGENSFAMKLDDRQPFARWMFGARAKLTGYGERVHETLTPTEVSPLAEVWRGNAARLRRVAEDWEKAAAEVDVAG